MPTAPTPIPPIPDPPPLTNSPNFDALADDTWEALPDTIDGMDATAANVYANALEVASDAADVAAVAGVALGATRYIATSTSILTMDAGSKVVVLAGVDLLNPPAFALYERIVLKFRASGSDTMLIGSLTAWDGVNHMTVDVDAGGVIGTGGPYNNWLVMAGEFFSSGASAAEVRAGITPDLAVTPQALMDAGAFTVLTYGSTVNWDFDAGFNRYLTLAGNPTMAAPTHLHDGLGCALAIDQGTGAHTITWNAIFDWGLLGAPTLSTGAGKVDFAFGIYSVLTGKIHMTFRKAA